MFYLQNATDFLLQAVIGLVLYIALLRFWMQWVKADFRNQIGQFIISVTNPAIIPLRKLLPSIGTIDTSSLVLAFAIGLIKIVAFLALRESLGVAALNYVIWGIGLFIKSSMYLFMAAIIVQVIASWINPHSYHPVLSIANSLANPITAPVRRILPPLGGIDFSALVVLLLIQFTLHLLAPISLLGV